MTTTTNNDLKQALASIAAATNGRLYDPEWDGGSWLFPAVQTTETIQNFEDASAHYNECGRVERGVLAGFQFVHFGTVQVSKGQQRKNLSVIDLGSVRFAIDEDLTNYI